MLISRAKYDQLLANSELLPSVTDRADGLAAELQETRTALEEAEVALRGLRQAVEIQENVQAQVEAMGDDIRPDATAAAIRELTEEARVALRYSIAAGVKDERRESVMEKVRLEEGPAIRQELIAVFTADGTFDGIEADAASAVRREIADKLRAEAKDKAMAEVSSPEARAAYLAEIAPRIAVDDEVLAHQADVTAKLHATWETEAIEEAKADIDAKIAAEEPDFKTEAQERYRDSYEGRQRIARLTEEAKTKAERMGVDELVAATRDTALQQTIDNRAAAEARKLEAETTATRLQTDFLGEGIDVTVIPDGTSLEIVLGKTSLTRSYGNEYVTAEVARRLRLTAMGDGTFRVNADTLAASSNLYAQQAAIEEGTIITIGLRTTNHGSEADDRHTLVPRLRVDTTLDYDTDTTTPGSFISTHLQVANVRVNGIAARTVNNEQEKLL